MAVIKKTTCTQLVVDYLTQLDDFATHRMIQISSGVTSSQITATLHDLRRFKAIDAMDVDGVLWFYATPERDVRTKTLGEIKEGITRKRKPKVRLFALDLTRDDLARSPFDKA